MKARKLFLLLLIVAFLAVSLEAQAKPDKPGKADKKGRKIIKFPVKKSRYTKHHKSFHVKTYITISSGGKIRGLTQVWTVQRRDGFTGGVVVFLLDTAGNVLYNTKMYKATVQGKMKTGASFRTLTWSDVAPKDVIKKARQSVIYHLCNPTPKTESWLKSKKGYAKIKGYAQKW